MKKFKQILLNAIPVLLMIGLIPAILNDYWLTAVYVLIILIALIIKKDKNDLIIFVFGFSIMIVSEYLFISTKVETFQRNSLLGLMPLWLPFLWGYGFIVIKRATKILDTK
ncbi:MAG: hypothetical protein WCN88_04625 [Candidatus Falkowbacteria bacterium]